VRAPDGSGQADDVAVLVEVDPLGGPSIVCGSRRRRTCALTARASRIERPAWVGSDDRKEYRA
jgi:hypothetical protein